MNGSLRFPGDVFAELDRLQQHFDQLFRPSSEPANIRALSRAGFPAINVGTTPDSIEVLAFAPGIDPKALQITIDKGLLVIAGERAATMPRAGQNGSTVYAQERFSGAFRRVLTLPEDADPAQVNASYRDGLLRVTVAKRESSKPRQITIS